MIKDKVVSKLKVDLELESKSRESLNQIGKTQYLSFLIQITILENYRNRQKRQSLGISKTPLLWTKESSMIREMNLKMMSTLKFKINLKSKDWSSRKISSSTKVKILSKIWFRSNSSRLQTKISKWQIFPRFKMKR